LQNSADARLAPGSAASLPEMGSMSRTSRNFVVAYILLVGLPLLGLVGVLRSGRKLSAPISVDGTWKINADNAVLANYPCSSVPSFLDAPLLISQSGKSLAISLGKAKTVATGLLENRSLKASVPQGTDSSSPACGADFFALTAMVDPMSEPRSLSGTLSAPGCASCAPVQFRAVRLPKTQTGGGH
jgi:hypothetical protein